MKIVLNFLIDFFSIFLIIYSQSYINWELHFKVVDNLGEKSIKETSVGGSYHFVGLNTSEGTLSDINGDFKILGSNFSNNLVFKFLGYKDQIVQYKNQS